MSKAALILDLLGKGVAYHEIARHVGVKETYVRAVRSRYSARDPETFWRRSKNARKASVSCNSTAPAVVLPAHVRKPYRKQRSGQTREELRVLAETLYRWRSEGRYA